MPVIGLTGGISSGKSTVSTFLSGLGAVVLNADELGHEALQPYTEVWREVVDVFGEGILGTGGEVDRQKLGEIVFGDAEAMARLNQIMHPRMYRMAEERIEELKKRGSEVIVLEAPLLVEAGWLPLVDKVWVTVASEETVVHRLCQRNGLSEAQALARISAQLPAEEKKRYADAVIDTDCTLSEVEAKVEELWEALQVKTVRERIRQALSQREKIYFESEGFTPTAVLIPLYEKTREYYIIVTKRTEEVNNHKGQISFPGGRRHAEDKTLMDTALRESWEEIGLNPSDVEIIGELDDALTATTKFIISPFVATIPYPYAFTANPREVEEIIEVPLAILLDKRNFSAELKLYEGELVPEYSYKYGEWVIWGATARILKQFLELVFGA